MTTPTITQRQKAALATLDFQAQCWSFASSPGIPSEGHDARSRYVEEFWLPVLGPTCIVIPTDHRRAHCRWRHSYRPAALDRAPKPLARLGTSDDPLTPEAHASCAGHVAWIDEEWIEVPPQERSDDSDDDNDYELTFKAVYGCSDPVGYGHVEASTTPARNSRNGTQTSKEAAKAERQRVLRNNKAWRASESVRRNWLRTFLTRKSAPKGAHRFVFAELAVGSYRLRDALDKQHRTACELLGIESRKALITAMNDASDARAQMIALALVLSAHEACLGIHTWRNPDAATAQYLSQFAAWGYELSEIEQSVIKSLSGGE
jgi:ParB family chromosome partitioning protein